MSCWDFKIIQTISTAALLIIIYVLYHLSYRLGEALHMKPYYHFFTLGFIFILSSLFIQLYVCFFIQLSNDQLILLLISILLSVGVTLSFIAAVAYWGWLITEIFK
jgi:hypothetical protein